jgi:diguanylate cyclase (GGDEF)-like protein
MPLRPERFHSFRSLMLAAVALIGLATCAMIYTIVNLRSDAIEDAYERTGNLATVLAEQIGQTIRTIDIMVSDLQERILLLDITTVDDLRRVMSQKFGHELLKSRLDQLGQADVVTVVDARGQLIATSRAWPASPFDLSDREHVRHFQTNGGKGTYIGLPVANKVTGTPTVFFVRPIRDANASLLGLIIVGIPIVKLQNIYETVGLLDDHGFMLARKTGEILVRYPNLEKFFGEAIPARSPWYDVVAKGGGQFRTQGQFVSGPRLVSARLVPNYPLVVSVGFMESAALAAWRQRSIFIAAGTVLIVICAWLLLSAIAHRIRELALQKDMLAIQSRELQTAKAQIDAAVDSITHGVAMFNSEQRLVLCNKRYLEIYALSPDVVKLGCNLREILELRKKTTGYPADPERQAIQTATQVLAGKKLNSVITMPDGRTITVIGQPTPDGGWVATHEDITERHRAEAVIRHMATHDALTDLFNRAAFEHSVKDALRRLHRHNERFALLILDLDKFKVVNDTLGHPAGDAVLRTVADRIRACIRDVDAAARLGGDEFAIIQSHLEDPELGARKLANRLLDEMRMPIHLGANQFRIGVSIGIALAPADGAVMDDLLRRGDLALYRAKQEGRNRLRFFDASVEKDNDLEWSRKAS